MLDFGKTVIRWGHVTTEYRVLEMQLYDYEGEMAVGTGL